MASLQKRLAAHILKVGKSRVWLDPTKFKDIDAAITKVDIRKLIKKGYVKALPEKLHRPKTMKKRRTIIIMIRAFICILFLLAFNKKNIFVYLLFSPAL